jgi:hypothetical protein
MALQVKNGGAWRNIANGNVRIKSGGAWRTASFCYIKNGGVWRDSGYRGYPNPPGGAPTVYSWDFANVRVQWPAPAAGGAPTVSTDVVMTNSALNPDSPMQSQNIPASSGVSNNFSVGEDYQVAFFVRSVSASGLKSAWAAVAPVRVLIGHSQIQHTVTDTLTRGWTNYSDFSSGPNGVPGLHRNEIAPIYVPSSVYLTQWRFHLGLSFAGPYISKPPAQGNRQIYYWNGSAGWDGTPWDVSGSTYDAAIGISNVNGQNLNWGIGVQGIGWSAAPSNAQILIGTIYLDGTEYYNQDRIVVDRYYQANQYW